MKCHGPWYVLVVYIVLWIYLTISLQHDVEMHRANQLTALELLLSPILVFREAIPLTYPPRTIPRSHLYIRLRPLLGPRFILALSCYTPKHS